MSLKDEIHRMHYTLRCLRHWICSCVYCINYLSPKEAGYNSFDICHCELAHTKCCYTVQVNSTHQKTAPHTHIWFQTIFGAVHGIRLNSLLGMFTHTHSVVRECECGFRMRFEKSPNENEVNSEMQKWVLVFFVRRLQCMRPKPSTSFAALHHRTTDSSIHNASFPVCTYSHRQQDVIIYTVNTEIRFTTF